MKKIIEISKGKRKVVTINDSPTKTQQQFKNDCDINNIIRKYVKTGQVTHLARKKGIYADLSHMTDYQESLQKVLTANDAFMALPSEIRNKFQNNPQLMLDFLADPKNTEEGIKLGLLERKAAKIEQNEQNEQNEKAAPESKPMPS